jgi:uncharacterized MAPEG superfamily protein
MSELLMSLMLNAGLFSVLLLMQPVVRVLKQGPTYALGNFDVLREEGVFAARLARAKNNQLEAVVLLAVLSLVVGNDSTLAGVGAAFWVFNLARVGYVGTVLMGVPMLRSTLWMTGILALAYATWILFA